MTSQAKLLLDEHIWLGLRNALVQRGYDVVHVVDAEMQGVDDETVLVRAVQEGRAVLTFNVRDFAPLAVRWFHEGRGHFGIILSPELGQGELLRQAVNLLGVITADDLKNTVRWLSEFAAD